MKDLPMPWNITSSTDVQGGRVKSLGSQQLRGVHFHCFRHTRPGEESKHGMGEGADFAAKVLYSSELIVEETE